MRRDLPALVSLAKTRAATVELETNGALVDNALAKALHQAGLDRARVHLPGWGDDADRVTRDPGGFAATARGVEALIAASVALEIAVPVVASNAVAIASLPARISEAGWPVEALVVGVPTRGPSSILPLAEAARAIERLEAEARRFDLALRLDPHTHVPPCLFQHPARIARLFRLTPGGKLREGIRQVEACATCVVGDRCPGVPEGAAVEPRPIAEDRVRRRLSLISTVEAQVARELFQDEVIRLRGGGTRAMRTVRVGFRCNQVCDFCFVSTHLPTAPADDVERVIREAAARGDTICISGGEPTLEPRLVDWVRLAKREGASFVELQTNATRIDASAAAELREAGVDLAFVSLHGSKASISDAVTGAPKTFNKTVAGIDHLLASSIIVRVNFVFCQTNLADFPDYVDWVAERWPGVEICVSFVAPSTDMVPRKEALIPRYSDVVPFLGEGVRRALAKGVALSGFDSMCGLPLCLVPRELTDVFAIDDAPDAYAGDEVVRSEACEGCDLRTRCFGLRRGYAELHGTGELRRIRIRP